MYRRWYLKRVILIGASILKILPNNTNRVEESQAKYSKGSEVLKGGKCYNT